MRLSMLMMALSPGLRVKNCMHLKSAEISSWCSVEWDRICAWMRFRTCVVSKRCMLHSALIYELLCVFLFSLHLCADEEFFQAVADRYKAKLWYFHILYFVL